MLSAAADGRESNERPSFRYTLHLWRRKMRASYQDMRRTPLDVIRSDLEYIDIEQTIRAAKAEQRNA